MFVRLVVVTTVTMVVFTATVLVFMVTVAVLMIAVTMVVVTVIFQIMLRVIEDAVIAVWNVHFFTQTFHHIIGQKYAVLRHQLSQLFVAVWGVRMFFLD